MGILKVEVGVKVKVGEQLSYLEQDSNKIQLLDRTAALVKALEVDGSSWTC